MTNNKKVRTIFRLVGELIADSLFPPDTEPASVSEPNPSPEPAEDPDPDTWLTVSDVLRMDCMVRPNGKPMTRRDFLDYRGQPESNFPAPGQVNAHRQYWQMRQINDWIRDPDKLAIDQFLSRRRAGRLTVAVSKNGNSLANH